MDDKNTFIQDLEHKLADTKTKLAEMKNHAEAERNATELQSKVDNLSAKIEEAKNAGEEKWQELKSTLQGAWDDVSNSLHR